MKPLFDLGLAVWTKPAQAAIAASGETADSLLARHAQLEQGELDDEDQEANRRALENGGRIYSRFKLKSGVAVLVITEASRYATTILLPEEY